MGKEYISAEPGMRRGAVMYHINDGNYYRLVSEDSTRAYLMCNRKTCSVRASMPVLPEDRTVESLRVRGIHSHGMDHNYSKVSKLKREILKRCIEENVKNGKHFRRIFHEECAKFDTDVSTRVAYRSMYLAMRRAKKIQETEAPLTKVEDKVRPLKLRKRTVITRSKQLLKRGSKYKGRSARVRDATPSPRCPQVEEIMDDDNVVVFYVGKNCPEALKDDLPVVHQEEVETEPIWPHNERSHSPEGSGADSDRVQPPTAEIVQAVTAAANEAAQTATAKIIEAITAASAEAVEAAVAEFAKAAKSITDKVTQAVSSAAATATETAAAEIAQVVKAAAAEATKSAMTQVGAKKAPQAADDKTTRSAVVEFVEKTASKVAEAITDAANEAVKTAAAQVAQAITAAAAETTRLPPA